jgi:diguanylate cyclase (GGDEF)-like protein
MSDPLTGIPNRRAFDERLESEWKRAMRDKVPLSFLMLDLDKFKDYNDRYGHQQGDELLKAAAAVIVACARRPGDLAARIGGEEFGVLLPSTKLENACVVAEKLRSGIEKLSVPTERGEETKITISIGVASGVPLPKSDSAELVGAADSRLYAAKSDGRNRVCR